MMRLHNPIRELTREQKIALGIAGGAVVGIATLAALIWASKSEDQPKRRPLEVDEDCTSYTINRTDLREALREQVRAAAKKGAIDPLQVAAKYIRSVAPRCPTYPEKTETPGQAQLFAEICTELLGVMQDANYLSASDHDTWLAMMTAWTTAQEA